MSDRKTFAWVARQKVRKLRADEALAELELRSSEARKTLRLFRAASGEKHSFDSSLESV